MVRQVMSALRELSRKAGLPPSSRRELLDELSGDLEELYGVLRARGLGPAAAWRAAAEMLLPDDMALRELAGLHRPVWVRWTERLTGPRSRGAADAVLVTILTGFVILSTMGALFNGGVLAPLTWSLAPVMVAGMAASALIAWQVFRVVFLAESRPERVRGGAQRIAVAGFVTLAVGALSAGMGLVAGVSSSTRETGGVEPNFLLLEWVPTAVAQLSLGLVVVLECGVAWMLLARRAGRLEDDTARALARVRGFHFPGARS
jgi:hypothetical protein